MAVSWTLDNLASAIRAIGRAVVLYQAHWIDTADIALAHLGDTEGDISVAWNESYSMLTLPELTGDAPHEAYIQGAAPVVSIPLFLADPALRNTLTPYSSGSGGLFRRQQVNEFTLALIPEEVFFDEATDLVYEALGYTTAGGWTIGGNALSATKLALLDTALFFWRGFFHKPPVTYRNADGGKAVDTVEFVVMQDTQHPNGAQMWSHGDPVDDSIDISPVTG